MCVKNVEIGFSLQNHRKSYKQVIKKMDDSIRIFILPDLPMFGQQRITTVKGGQIGINICSGLT